MKILFAFLIPLLFICDTAISQQIYVIGNYEFEIGCSENEIMQRYPEFTFDEYIGDNEDDTQMYFIDSEKEVNFSLNFYGGRLGRISVNDEWGTGVFGDFIPEDMGFTKVKEESEFIDNVFSNVVTHFYIKENIEIKACWGRFGFLEIIDKNISNL